MTEPLLASILRLRGPRPADLPAMRHFTLLSFFAAMALLTACADALPTPQEAIDLQCQCQANAMCPPDVCDIELEISQASCAGQVGDVELQLGKQLDPQIFHVGAAKRTCATIPRGTSLRMWARASRPANAGSNVPEWQWVEDVACPARSSQDVAGPTIARVLQCSETGLPTP